MDQFISYAQNCEDVMLWRALKHIDKGFYVDVGAHDPIIDSVTKAFSCRGWRGINIEPVNFWYKKLLNDRCEDINIQAVASSVSGSVEFFEVVESGLSTVVSDIAQQHSRNGFEVINHTVPSLLLRDIFDQYQLSTIHFLKIDVEGSEEDVIKGLDFTKIRPWIILVEAIEPNSITPSFQKWEHYLLENGYMLVYFDGVNRYYLCQSHRELRDAFNAPPNVFDNFLQYQQWLAQENLRQQLKASQIELEKIIASFSWRITAPLRKRNWLSSVRGWFK